MALGESELARVLAAYRETRRQIVRRLDEGS
jgi:hypothetical protein